MSHWISDPADLRQRLQDAPPRVGLDTEFVRERTWWPRLALVQLSLGDGSLLLADAQAPGLPEAHGGPFPTRFRPWSGCGTSDWRSRW